MATEANLICSGFSLHMLGLAICCPESLTGAITSHQLTLIPISVVCFDADLGDNLPACQVMGNTIGF